MIVLFVWTNAFRVKLSKLINKLDEIAVTAKTSTADFKDFIDRTIASLEKFKNRILTVEFIRTITTEVISIINKKKGKK